MAMLAYLAVTGQSYSRDALATLFWPESDQSLARAALRKTLFVLNKTLAGEALVVDPETVGLARPDMVWLDVAQFQDTLAECQAHNHPPDESCAGCLLRLASAVELYTADFLAGFTLPDCPAFDEWQFFQAEGYRQALAKALEQLVYGYISQGQFEAAIIQARRWLVLDPLHEPAHRHLMWLYAQTGQQAAALRQYQECTRLLKEEMAVLPEEATTALYEAIKTRQLSPYRQQHKEATKPEIRKEILSAASQPANASITFVAREGELAQLDAFLMRAMARQGQVAFVTGEAGRGKTALVQEFARRALEQHPELIVVGGLCNAYTGIGDPYLPFRQILSLLTGDMEARWSAGLMSQADTGRLSALLPWTVQALASVGPDLVNTFISGSALLHRLMPALSGSLPLLPGEGPGSGFGGWGQLQAWLSHRKDIQPPIHLTQNDLFEQYTRVLQTLARQQPLLLILDDLQWADTGSISLLFYLGRQLDHSRILVVGAYRPTELALGHPFPHSTVIPVGESEAGFRERHPLETVVSEFQRKFGQIQIDLRQADGRRFVEAFLDTEPNRFGPEFREALYQHTQGHALFTIEMLRGMQERGDLVRDEAGRWAEGPAINWEALPPRVEGVIAQRLGRLPEALQEILRLASVEGEAFTAEVIAQALTLDERQVVRQLSQILDRQHRLVMGQGSRRLEASGRRLSGYRFRHILFQRYLYHNLDEAERGYLHETVAEVLEQLYGDEAEEIAPQLARHFEAAGQTSKAMNYLLKAGNRAASIYANTEAIAYFSQALALARPAGATELLTGLYSRLGRVLELEAQTDQALAIYEEMEQVARQRDDRPMILAALMAQATLYTTPTAVYHPARGQALTEQALALAQSLGDQAAEAKILYHLLNIYSYMSQLGQAIASGERSLALARRLNLREQVAFTLNNLGTRCYQAVCDFERAKAALAEAVQLWRELDNRPMLADSLTGLGSVHVYTGEYEQAIAFSEEASQISQAIGNLWGQSYSRYKVGWAYWERGEPDQAIAVMVESIRLSELAGFLGPQVITRADLAALYGSLGALERGLETAQAALAIATGQMPLRHFYVMGILAQLYLWSDHPAEAEALVAQGQQAPDREAFPLYAFTIPIAGIELALRQGHYQQVATESNRLLSQLRQSGMQSQIPKVLYWQGQALLALGQAKAAYESLAKARAAAEAIGSQAILWQILAMLSQLETNPAEAERRHRQAHVIVKEIAGKVNDPELRTSFLRLPQVQAILT
jgi:predicted ATPase/DNA-binding SARP family transcriptional activator